MLKRKLKAFLTVCLTVCIVILMAAPVFADETTEKTGQWMHDENGFWFKRADGGYTANDWLQIGYLYYYFDENGYTLSDTTTPDGYQVDYFGARIDDYNPGTAQVMQKTDTYDPEYPLKGQLEEFGLSITPNYFTGANGEKRWFYTFDSGVIFYGGEDEGAHVLSEDGLVWTVDNLYSVYNAYLEADVIAMLAGLPVDETDYPYPLGGDPNARAEQEYLRIPRGDALKAEAWEVRRFLNSFDWLNASDLEKATRAAKWVARGSYNYDNSWVSNHYPYGSLVLRKAVCEGISESYLLLTRCMGMKCLMVADWRYGGPHGWNVIEIDGRLWDYDGTLNVNNNFEDYLFTDERYLIDDTWMDRVGTSVPRNLYKK